MKSVKAAEVQKKDHHNGVILGENERKVRKFFIWNKAFARNKWFVIVAPVLVIAAVSVAILAFAANTVVANIEAENMTLSMGGSIVMNDDTASGKRAVKLTQYYSTLNGSVNTSSGTSSISVVARGLRCYYSWPSLTLVIDGQTALRNVAVNSSSWKSFSSAVSLPSGTHSVKIISSGSCRNLYVDTAVFYASSVTAPVPAVTLSAAPTTVVNGSSATLAWSSMNATACSASGAWSGNQTLNGTAATAAILANSTYTLTCSGSGGTATASVTVTVQTPTTPPGSSGVSCTKYAAPNGSDSSTGTLSLPFLTVQKLADNLSAGQTGCLRAGTYTKNSSGYTLNARVGGSVSAPITIASYPGERAKLVGTVQIQKTANYFVLSSVDIVGDGSQQTIQIYNTNGTIQYSDITNNLLGGSCLHLGNTGAYGVDGPAIGTMIKNNRIHDCGLPANGVYDHCVYAAHTSNVLIQNNVFFNCTGFVIQFYPNAQSTTFDHNTVDGGPITTRGGVIIGSENTYASNNNVVSNNILTYSNASPEIYSLWGSQAGSGNNASNNCTWAPNGSDTDNSAGGLTISGTLHADPLFTDRAGHNYSLRSGSPCTGKGAAF